MGTMAGLPQASIIIQLLLNMVELGLDPQQSLSKPRFILGAPLYAHPDSALFVDPGFPQESLRALQQRGHSVNVSSEKESFLNSGHANIMARESLWSREALEGKLCSKKSTGNGLIWCGVEPRINGAALGY
ncbi:hypothetical protein HPB50_021721 [Hyalomma asiaticum]|uniref:Uncharacterized protein n=1 Tax=Hyalomma asiaticum TaxID=266040 RepID=A0ACB7TB00_HYAAI|nr:hypothetical protein HPB50_021721 [Hyalomma asiaticum]